MTRAFPQATRDTEPRTGGVRPIEELTISASALR
jgi:hypothetical protein